MVAAVPAPQEYEIKGILLFNFTQFVEWPPAALPPNDAPIVIGILGKDPFGPTLDAIVRNEKCGARGIKIERYRNVEAVRNCQILFVSRSEQDDLQRIFRVLRDRPILTVGDFEDFARKGGMISWETDPTAKVRLHINLAAVKASELIVSAKLLRVADIVTPAE